MKLGLLQLTPSGFNLLCLDLTVERDLPDSPPWLQDYYLCVKLSRCINTFLAQAERLFLGWHS